MAHNCPGHGNPTTMKAGGLLWVLSTHTHSLLRTGPLHSCLLPVITGKNEGNEVTDQSGGVQRVE